MFFRISFLRNFHSSEKNESPHYNMEQHVYYQFLRRKNKVIVNGSSEKL